MSQTGTLEYTGGTASSTMPFSMAAGGNGTLQIDTAATDLSLSGVISGSGSLSKSGAGTLILAANNSFAGGLSVQQGTLSIATINNLGASGPLGAGPSVTLGSMSQAGTLDYTGGTASSTMPFSMAPGGNGTLQIDTAATSLSLSGVVSGSGALTKSGPGTLILSGNNTFTGGLTINAGMVQLGNSGALNATTPIPVHFGAGSTGILNLGGSGSVTISSLQSNTVPGSPIVENVSSTFGQHSTLTINDSGTETFAGVLRDDPAGQGVLGIAKSGTGTLVLTSANTDTGGTTINGGTLQLGDGLASNGSVAGDIGDNSALVFANPNPQTYSAVLFGSGSVTKTGPGPLTVGGNNSFTGGLTIQQGTLIVATINNAHVVGSLGVNSNVTLSSNGQTATLEYTGVSALSNMSFTLIPGGNSAFQIDSAATNLTLSGILSGGGNLTKAGAGALSFNGNNTYTGSTTVNNGTLTTATAGRLGSGSLVVNGNAGGTSTVNLGSNQSVASLSGVVVAGSSAGVNVGAGTTLSVAQASNTTFAGAVGLANGASGGAGGTLNKSGVGTLEIDGGLTFGNNSSLAVSGGRLRLNVNSGSVGVGSGATAIVGGGAILELAGTTSALGTTGPNNRVAITDTSNAAAGFLVSAGNQQVGGINGNGNTQVSAGASLTADHIIQTALIIGGTSSSRGLVVIDASDSSGNPLASSLPTSINELPTNAFEGANSPTFIAPEAAVNDPLDSSSAAGGAADGKPSAVPEPSTLTSMLLAVFVLHRTIGYAVGFSASQPRSFSAAKSR
jgi:fibronectin-binding autotransporter adhesin